MGLFDFFKPKNKQVSHNSAQKNISQAEEQSQVEISRSYNKHILEEGISVGTIVLLWWSDGKSVAATIPQYFLYDYFINANNEIQKLFDKGFLRWSKPKEHLDSLKVADIKHILEKNGLPKTGRKKDELIERINDNLSDEIVLPFITNKIYKVTDKGEEILNKYSNILWGHKNNSKDGTINAFTFEKILDISPNDYAIEILENSFIEDIKNYNFGLASNRLRNISNLKGGDIEILMQEFCFEISGLSNSNRYLFYNTFYPYTVNQIKTEIARQDLDEIEIEKNFKLAWQKCYQIFPASIVNKENDALDLLFLSINGNKDDFELLMKNLYQKVPDKYKLNF